VTYSHTPPFTLTSKFRTSAYVSPGPCRQRPVPAFGALPAGGAVTGKGRADYAMTLQGCTPSSAQSILPHSPSPTPGPPVPAIPADRLCTRSSRWFIEAGNNYDKVEWGGVGQGWAGRDKNRPAPREGLAGFFLLAKKAGIQSISQRWIVNP
jgi:hypothetical protein